MADQRRFVPARALSARGISVLSLQQIKNGKNGELPCAFNSMAAKLKAVTATRTLLEREIAERRLTQETLLKY